MSCFSWHLRHSGKSGIWSDVTWSGIIQPGACLIKVQPTTFHLICKLPRLTLKVLLSFTELYLKQTDKQTYKHIYKYRIPFPCLASFYLQSVYIIQHLIPVHLSDWSCGISRVFIFSITTLGKFHFVHHCICLCSSVLTMRVCPCSRITDEVVDRH